MVLYNRGHRDAKPPENTQALADFFGAQGAVCASLSKIQDLSSGLLTPPFILAMASASLGTNMGAQQAQAFHFPKNQKS